MAGFEKGLVGFGLAQGESEIEGVGAREKGKEQGGEDLGFGCGCTLARKDAEGVKNPVGDDTRQKAFCLAEQHHEHKPCGGGVDHLEQIGNKVCA